MTEKERQITEYTEAVGMYFSERFWQSLVDYTNLDLQLFQLATQFTLIGPIWERGEEEDLLFQVFYLYKGNYHCIYLIIPTNLFRYVPGFSREPQAKSLNEHHYYTIHAIVKNSLEVVFEGTEAQFEDAYLLEGINLSKNDAYEVISIDYDFRSVKSEGVPIYLGKEAEFPHCTIIIHKALCEAFQIVI